MRGPAIGTPSHSSSADAPAVRSELSAPAVQATATAFAVLFCIVGLALWGLPYYYDFMLQQFGWSRAQVTSGNALSRLVVGPLFGFAAGWLVDRFGPRRLMLVGILMAAIALVGLGSVSSLSMFYFFYFFNALGYVCGGPLPNQVLLTRWFDRSRGKAMGVAYLGIGLGGAVVPWLSHYLVEHFGWQSALRFLGVIVFVIAFPLAFYVKEPQSAPRLAGTSANVPLRAAFASPWFYLLIFASMCSIAAVSGTQQNLKLFLTLDAHYAQTQATRILSLVLFFSMAGRLLMGWLADHLPKKYVMALIYLIVAAAIPFLFATGSAFLMYAFAILFGIGLGGDYMIVPLITAELFDVQLLGRLLGVILTAGGIAEAVAPWIVGHIRDVTGSYSKGFLLLIAISLLASLSTALLPKRRVQS
jgi:sugar phosphate permease